MIEYFRIIKKEIINVRELKVYNDNNIIELTPFNINDGILEIEEEQYDAWDKTDGLELLKKEGFEDD